uniref:GMP synthase (glutamine-hydrolyzing) n=1 Tax=Ignisphaera aggregans TaxID=334771 RepID=A0A7J3JNW5_9CREN
MLTYTPSIERLVAEVRSLYRDVDCAIACVSGGVDSTVSAIIARIALGDRVYPVFIDTGFMRLGEAERVRDALRGLLDLEVYNFADDIVSGIEGLFDAEEKRIAFREGFYRAVKDIAEEKRCSWVVQGTIKADVVETVGRIKTQHNVLNEELLKRFNLRVIEPLIDLYKHEVREVARQLGLPRWIAERQPFPGPGLLIRTVGRFYREKLELVRKATEIVEEKLGDRGYSQYFPAIWEYQVAEEGRIDSIEYLVFSVRTTGVVDGVRVYGHPLLIRRYPAELDTWKLYRYFDSRQYPHVLTELVDSGGGEYVAAIRIVKTENYMVAEVPRVDIDELKLVAENIVSLLPKVRVVAFDITPKPPATIEYE